MTAKITLYLALKLRLLKPFSRWPALCLLLAACHAKTSIDVSRDIVKTEPGVSLALARQRIQQLQHPRYELSFSIPSDVKKPVTGQEDLYFQCINDTSAIQVDFKGNAGQLAGLTVDGDEAPVDLRDEHLIIHSAFLHKGKVHVHLRFTSGDRPLNRSKDYLYTLLVPDRARELFPCFDQPDLKAVFTLTLNVPNTWKVLANAPAKDSASQDSIKTFRFLPSDTISTYLFSFVAGKFVLAQQSWNGRLMHALYRETDTARLRLSLDSLFRIQGQAIDFLQAYTQVPYPFQKFDFAAIPSFQFGGMEHVGAIQYQSSSLFLDGTATREQLYGRANLLSHETSHMWFGDLVTMRWFSDVWMKEVFANFMADKIAAVSSPGSNLSLKFLTNHYPAAYAVDRTAGANPIRQQLDNLQDAGSLYGGIIYNKAPIMMRQLELRMGVDAFRDGIREYMHQFAYGNASWPELIAILQKHTAKPLGSWNNVWVNEPGRPVFSYSCQFADNRVSALSIDQAGENGLKRTWPQIFDLAFVYPDRIDTIIVDMDSGRVNVQAATGKVKPQYILFNASGLGYGVFPVDPGAPGRIASLPNPVLRASAYINQFENMLDGVGTSPRTFLLRNLGYIPSEPEELNMGLLLGEIGYVYWHFLSPTERKSLSPMVEKDLWAAISKAPSANEKKLLFNTYVHLCETKQALDSLYGIWTMRLTPPQGVKLSELDFTDIAEELALRNYPDGALILQHQATRIENPDRKVAFQFLWPALSPDPAVRDSFFYSLKDPSNRKKESLVVRALGYLTHPIHGNYGEKYIEPSLQWLQDIQRTGDVFFPQNWLQATIGNARTDSAAATINNFLTTHPDFNPALKGKILQASDNVFRNQKLSGRGKISKVKR